MQNLHVRWMIKRDMPEVLEIEKRCFEFPWSEENFINCLKNRNRIGMVADDGDCVAGYMIYELFKERLELLNFAVAPCRQRKGVGRAMQDKLARKLTPQYRSRILANVREANVDAQLFLRAMGYRCVSTLRDYYDDTTEDAYVFQYRVTSPAATPAVSTSK